MREVPLILYTGSAGPSRSAKPLAKHSPAEIYTYQPQQASPEIQFPYDCKSFIFPNNIEFNIEPLQTVSVHYFNFPNAHGRQFFGICCNFDLQVSHDIANQLLQEQILSEDDFSEIYADHSIFMLFSEPIHQNFVQFLDFYAHKVINHELQFNQIAELMRSYFPLNLRPPFTIAFGDISQSLMQGSKNQYEVKVGSIHSYGHSVFPQTGLLFRKLSPEVIADVIEAILQEKTVLLTSNNQQINSQIIYELLGIIFPFNYPYPFYSTLPLSYMQLLHSPVPIIASIPAMLLEGQTLNPQTCLVDVQSSKFVTFQDFHRYKIRCRYCIPRHALQRLQSQFCYIISNDQDATKCLANTMNYQQSDNQVYPTNVRMQKVNTIRKGVFKKEIEYQYVDIDPQSHAQLSLLETTSNEPSMASDSLNQHIMRAIVPHYYNSRLLSFQMEVNDRLFYYQAIRDLNLKSQHVEADTVHRKQSLCLDIDKDDTMNVLSGMALQRLADTGFIAQFNELNVVVPNFAKTKKFEFIEQDYKASFGQSECLKPALPPIIKKLLIIVIDQNSTFYKQDNKSTTHAAQLLEYDEETTDSMSNVPDANAYPNPMTMLFDALLVQQEQRLLGIPTESTEYSGLVNLVEQLPQHFDHFCQNVRGINAKIRDEIVRVVRNTPHNLVPDPFNKKIDIPRLRTGITAVLLLLVQHYRKSLQTSLTKRSRPISSVINLQTHKGGNAKQYQIVINEHSQKLALQHASKQDITKMFQDISTRRLANATAHSLIAVDMRARAPYAKIFDYRTFIAETPTMFRQFMEFFAYSKLFQAFLETRLSEQTRTEGHYFSSMSRGQYYAQGQSSTSQTTSTMTAGSSVIRETNMSTVFNINKPSIEARSQHEESLTETNYEQTSENLDIDTRLEYGKIKSTESIDIADLILRNSKLLNDAEERLINENSNFEFLILKQGVGQLGQKWNERIIHVKINQTPMQITWRKCGAPQEKYKGLLKIVHSFLVEIPAQNNYPSSYPVQVQGVITDSRGKEQDRRLVFCFQNAAEQRLFIILTRQCYRHQSMERIRSAVVLDHIAAIRKARRLAIGNLQKNLEKYNGDILDWIFSSSDIQ